MWAKKVTVGEYKASDYVIANFATVKTWNLDW